MAVFGRRGDRNGAKGKEGRQKTGKENGGKTSEEIGEETVKTGAIEERQGHRVFSGSGIRASAQFRCYCPGGGDVRPQSHISLRSGFSERLSGLWVRGASGQSVRTNAAGGNGQVLDRFHQRPYSELPQESLRPDRQLREGLLGGDRVDCQMGREGFAAGAGTPQAGCRLRRQCHSISGNQALRAGKSQALGPDHLVLGKRDRGSQYSAPSVRLQRKGQGRFREIPATLQRSDPDHSRGFQRFPEGKRGGHLSSGAVLRSIAAYEPAAISHGRAIQAAAQAVGEALPISRRMRAQGQALYAAPVQGARYGAAALCQFRFARGR